MVTKGLLDRALVGVVSGSGVVGMRATDRLPYFLSGVGYPDCLLLAYDSADKRGILTKAAGFFGQDWSLESGTMVWSK